jgi:amino acid transporter
VILTIVGAEVKKVQTRAPYSIILSTVSNAVMQFAFVICLLFTIGDLDTVTSSPTGLPMIEVYYLATKSVAATNIFIVAIFFVVFVAMFNTYASVSRLTWAFACDHGLPFSKTFAKVS